MKRKLNNIWMALMFAGILLLVTSGMASATRYEAENGDLIGMWIGTIPAIFSDPAASNGAGVGSLGKTEAGDPTAGVKFTNMPAINAFSLGYSSNLADSKVSLYINNNHVTDLYPPSTGGWNVYSTMEVTGITVNAGDSISIIRDELDVLEKGINIDYIDYGLPPSIPEFPTIVLPVAAVLGLMFLITQKKR